MQNVRQIARGIVAREGGFVNDPDDPGGATNHGVTIHTLRKLGLDLTGDGKVGVADVQALSVDQAIGIFEEYYFRGPGLDRLPDKLQPVIFDMYVNAGANAVRILQRVLCEMGYEIAVDGVIGPRTLRAAQDAARPNGALLRDAYAVARRNYYFRLADRRQASRKFARTRAGGKGGWIRRAEEFMSDTFRMSDSEFQERVAGWD